MAEKTLKQKTISGMIWNGIERFGSSLFLFISNLVLARLLSPDDFGCIGMLLVFISLSETIIDGGFGSALIQKKNPTQVDYSTIFYWNIILSVFLYVVLYLCSPYISEFYEIPILCDLLRILGLSLIFNSLFLIQNNILKKNIHFKTISKINLISTGIGAILGIVAAYSGLGVWSLIIKTIATSLIQCILYWIVAKWFPLFVFSWSSFKELFKFGGFIFMNTIINAIHINLLSLVIGKCFSSAELGYFTQARKLQDMPRSTISSVVNNVTFPMFSHIKDDEKKVQNVFSKCFKILLIVVIPLMFMLIIIAKPVILLLLTDKWIEAVPYFKLLCINGILLTMIELNSNVITAMGNSKKDFYVRLFQRILGLIFIVGTIRWGITGLLVGFIVAQFLSYLISSSVTKKVIGYGTKEQMRDVFPFIIFSLISMFILFKIQVYFSNMHLFMQSLLPAVLFILIYCILILIFNRRVLIDIRLIFKK